MTLAALDLLFFKDGGIRFAVEREQVRSVQVLETGSEKPYLHYLAALGCSGRPGSVPEPVLLTLRTEPPCAVLVDELESIAEVQTFDLRPLPPLAEPWTRPKGLWALALVDGKLILLADLRRMRQHLLQSPSHRPS